MSLLLIGSERFGDHQTPPGHPESPARAAVKASEALRKVARFVSPLALVADSVYLSARKAA